jgi:phage terminase small subunit
MDEKKRKKAGLSSKQQAFVDYYVGEARFVGAEAARLAGYAEGSARQQASRLLTNDDVQEAIKQRISEIAMSSHEVLVRLSEHARGSMEDFIDPETMLVDLHKAADKKQLHLLKKIKYVTRTQIMRDGEEVDEATRIDTIEFELYDQQAALALLGKHHKLFVERHEMTGKDGKAIPISIQPFSDMDDDELDQFIQENGG